MPSEWVMLREYSSQLDADLDIGFLHSNDIPTRTEGPTIGVVGPGFVGSTADGVRVFVPRELAEEAADLLTDVNP